MMQQHQENLYRSLRPSLESVEKGKRDFVDHFDQLSHQNAQETAQALKTVPTLTDKVINALSALCGNPTYNSSSLEDQMNDYVRDMLRQNLNVHDQTRQGVSGKSKSAEEGHAGEQDAQIWFNGRPIGIYEGLRLDGVNSNALYDHMNKAVVNYNPQSLKEVFATAYIQKHTDDFGDFWEKFDKCIRRYNRQTVVWENDEIDTSISAVRGIHGVYQMDGQDHNLYVFAVKIQK